MATVQRGCLAIGDITGYTKYLAGVELEHSQDVLSDLMNVLAGQMRGLLHLAKLEGDGVFCYDHDDGGADGSPLRAMLESCYVAFVRRRQTINRHTTCECNACRLLPTLDLKFLVHHGEFVLHDVAGSRELMGRDVILVHRMLKSTFTQRTGVRGYAMFTEACLRRFALDPEALGMTAHIEAHEDVGEVAAHALNLEERWKRDQEHHAVHVAEGQGVTMLGAGISGPRPASGCAGSRSPSAWTSSRRAPAASGRPTIACTEMPPSWRRRSWTGGPSGTSTPSGRGGSG